MLETLKRENGNRYMERGKETKRQKRGREMKI
jgi:hypothetical protein